MRTLLFLMLLVVSCGPPPIIDEDVPAEIEQPTAEPNVLPTSEPSAMPSSEPSVAPSSEPSPKPNKWKCYKHKKKKVCVKDDL